VAPDLVIHIGIRKSATTWLQNHFFPGLAEVNYIAKTDGDYPRWLIDWHYLDDFEFLRCAGNIRDALTQYINRERPNIISSEAFTNTAVIWQQAHRIKMVYPNSRILVTVRDPIDTLISHYKLDVAEGSYHLPLEQYLDWERTPYDLVKRRPIYLPDFFYNEMIGLYQNLFDPKNVCVLRYEDMVHAPDEYFARLSSFVGVACNSAALQKLSEKANAGASDDAVRRQKARNLMKLLGEHYPIMAASVAEADILVDISTAIVPGNLRSRLETFFKGKCYGYY
jgi:hypothetical protein